MRNGESIWALALWTGWAVTGVWLSVAGAVSKTRPLKSLCAAGFVMTIMGAANLAASIARATRDGWR